MKVLCTGDTVTAVPPGNDPSIAFRLGCPAILPTMGDSGTLHWQSGVRRSFSYVSFTGNCFVVFRTSLLLHKRWLLAWNFGYLSSQNKMRWSATRLPLSWSAPLFSRMHKDVILRLISWRRFFYFQQHRWRLGMQNQPIPTDHDVHLEICGSSLCNSEYDSFLLCTEVIKLFFSCSTQLSILIYHEYQNSQTLRHFQIQTHQTSHYSCKWMIECWQIE